MGKEYQGLFSDWEVAVAKSLVNSFQTKWTCLGYEDFDDLLQECLIAWYYAREHHDSKRGASKKTFMARIIRNKLMDLIRTKESGKREDISLTISLDEPLNDDDCSTLIERIIPSSREHPPSIHLQLDLKNVIQNLTERQKMLCHLLGDGLTVQEAAQVLGRSRSVIYEDVKDIREAFVKHGLENYLK